MPKVIDPSTVRRRAGRDRTFTDEQLDEYFDGQARLFVQGEDYEGTETNLRNILRNAASARGHRGRISVIKVDQPDHERGAVVQAHRVEDAPPASELEG